MGAGAVCGSGCARGAPQATSQTGQARSETSSCNALREADEILLPGRVVMLGEMHGTREFPRFCSDLACAAAKRGPVSVGLEIPRDEQLALDQYLVSGGQDTDKSLLLATRFWSRRYQDGRSSAAMFSLIEDLRRIARQTGRVTVFAMDAPSGASDAPGARDRAMADAVVAAHRKAPSAVVLTLTGNVHNRTARGVPWDAAYVPMGALVAGEGIPVISLDGAYSNGTEWACTSGEQSSCGLVMLRANTDHGERIAALPNGQSSVRAIELFTRPSEEGFHGRFTIGRPTASPPAVSAR